jgi:hypothetical protein
VAAAETLTKCLAVSKNETEGNSLAEDQELVFMIGRDAPDASLCQGDCCGQKEGGTIKQHDFCPRPFLVSVHPSGSYAHTMVKVSGCFDLRIYVSFEGIEPL